MHRQVRLTLSLVWFVSILSSTKKAKFFFISSVHPVQAVFSLLHNLISEFVLLSLCPSRLRCWILFVFDLSCDFLLIRFHLSNPSRRIFPHSATYIYIPPTRPWFQLFLTLYIPPTTPKHRLPPPLFVSSESIFVCILQTLTWHTFSITAITFARCSVWAEFFTVASWLNFGHNPTWQRWVGRLKKIKKNR